MSNSRTVVRFVVGLAMVFGTGCQSDSKTTASDYYAVSQSEIATLASLDIPTQYDLAKDGKVTFQDYEAAALDFVHCVEGAGAALAEPMTLSVRQTYWLSFTMDDAGGDARNLGGIVSTCRSQYFDAIQGMWNQHTAPSQADLQKARDRIGECLRAAGQTVPKHPQREDFDPYRGIDPIFARCQSSVDRELGLPDFEG